MSVYNSYANNDKGMKMSAEQAVAELANEFERFKRVRENEHEVWNDLQQEILALEKENARRLDTVEALCVQNNKRIHAVEKICLDNTERIKGLESDVAGLKEGQARLESRMDRLGSDVADIKATLALILEKLS